MFDTSTGFEEKFTTTVLFFRIARRFLFL